MDCNGGPDDLRAVSVGKIFQLVLELAPLQREMAPLSPAPALYILAGGEELRRSCAPPCSRFSPTLSARTLPRSRAGSPVAAEGTPLRRSTLYWSVEAIMS